MLQQGVSVIVETRFVYIYNCVTSMSNCQTRIRDAPTRRMGG